MTFWNALSANTRIGRLTLRKEGWSEAAVAFGFTLEEIEQATMETTGRSHAVDWYTLADYLEKRYGKG